jgi:hypothetical protein
LRQSGEDMFDPGARFGDAALRRSSAADSGCSSV